MRRSLIVVVSLLVLVFSGKARPETLNKAPDHVYICTFNVYKLGSVADKYLSLEEEFDVPTGGIPDRIKNLASVLAVGRFDMVVLQEVTEGVRGE